MLRLLASDKPVIGGVGRMRAQAPNSDPSVWCWRPLHRDGRLTTDDMGAIEVAGVGAAFLLINKGIVVDMLEANPDWKIGSPPDWPEAIKPLHYELFRPEQNGPQFISEITSSVTVCARMAGRSGSIPPSRWGMWALSTTGLGFGNSFGDIGMMTVTLNQDVRPWRAGDDVHLPDEAADALVASGEAGNKRPFARRATTSPSRPLRRRPLSAATRRRERAREHFPAYDRRGGDGLFRHRQIQRRAAQSRRAGKSRQSGRRRLH